MARVRFCASCEARLPRTASPRRRYCDDACWAQAYRERRTTGRMLRLGEAEWHGDTGIVRLLTCPVCGRLVFAGADRRQYAVYGSGRCRSRAWRRRAARQARSRA